MTRKQRNALLRLILADIEEIRAEKDTEKREEKLKKVAEHLRDALED